MGHHDPEIGNSEAIVSTAWHDVHKDHPWHVFSFIKTSNEICSQNATQQLEEPKIQPEDGEEEKNGHDDTE